MIDRLTDWVTNRWLTDWLIERLIAHWLIDWLTDWLIDLLIYLLTYLLTDWLTDWLTYWSTGWLTDSQPSNSTSHTSSHRASNKQILAIWRLQWRQRSPKAIEIIIRFFSVKVGYPASTTNREQPSGGLSDKKKRSYKLLKNSPVFSLRSDALTRIRNEPSMTTWRTKRARERRLVRLFCCLLGTRYNSCGTR